MGGVVTSGAAIALLGVGVALGLLLLLLLREAAAECADGGGGGGGGGGGSGGDDDGGGGSARVCTLGAAAAAAAPVLGAACCAGVLCALSCTALLRRLSTGLPRGLRAPAAAAARERHRVSDAAALV